MADQQEPTSFFSSITPAVVATLIVAVVSVLGALGVAVYNAGAQRELERQQFESNLILKAIGTGDKKLSADNLRFLIEGGLIRKESEKVSRIVQDTSLHIHFPVDKPVAQENRLSYPIFAASPDPVFSGIIVDRETMRPIKGATIYISTNRSLRQPIEAETTNSDGRFSLHYPSRNYTLSCICPGYIEVNEYHLMAMRFEEPLILKLRRSPKPDIF